MNKNLNINHDKNLEYQIMRYKEELNKENWIYTKDELPPTNEKVLLYIMTDTNLEYSKFGIWNGQFYETNNSDYSKNEVIAWQKIDAPQYKREIINQTKLEQNAESYAKERVDYESEYANAMEEPITKEKFLEWVKEHIYYTSKNGFYEGCRYAKSVLLEK